MSCDIQWKYILIFELSHKIGMFKNQGYIFLLEGIKKVIQIIKGKKESRLQNLELILLDLVFTNITVWLLQPRPPAKFSTNLTNKNRGG